VQTALSLEHFNIGDDLIPREMIPAYAIVKKTAALVYHRAGRLGDTQKDLIVRGRTSSRSATSWSAP
jgi:fumarate hydratase class II